MRVIQRIVQREQLLLVMKYFPEHQILIIPLSGSRYCHSRISRYSSYRIPIRNFFRNKILPESEVVVNTENTEYQYDSIEEAVEKIKELEIELDNATSSGSTDAQTIAELQAQIEELMVYKQEQADFEKEKEKYYEEVVFSDKAPDINEYKTYYESIDPENAEVLYKRVIEQIEEDQKIKDYAATYSTMKPKEAAAIFDTMTGDLKLVAKILMAMDTESRASILGKMNTDTAAKLTQMMKP